MGELIRYLYQTSNYKLYLLYIDDGKTHELDYPYVIECLERYEKIDRQCSRLQTYKSLWRLLNEIKPDIVHDWSGYRIGIYLLPRLFYRKFFYIAGYLADGNKDSFIQSFIYQLVYLFSDKIISNSYAGILSHKAPLKKSIVIYNGFNSDRLSTVNNSSKLRDELKLGDSKIVSMAARVTPEKDYYMFLNVALRVQQKRNDIKFLIIGRGKMENKLKEYAQEKGITNTIFLGFRQDVIDLLKLSDVSLLCSNSDLHAEGVSNSIMESMACGTPVIATDGGGTSEIIETGKNGYIVKPHDDSEMTNILLQILEDDALHNNLSLEGLKTIETKFSISKMVNKYIETYNEAKNENSRNTL